VLISGVLAGCSMPQAAGPQGSSSSRPSQSKPPSSPSPTVTIQPVLVVAAVDVDGKHVTASGYVQGVIEDGGTCTFSFARSGSPAVRVQHQAIADRSTTSCGAVQPEITQFSRGSWQVTLEYISDGKDYVSTPLALEVP
jgi:hypothetical protein